MIGNAIRFRYRGLRGIPWKPAALSLAVTNRCNSHCIMCSIWKNARDTPGMKSLELSNQEIVDLLSKSLFSELVELDLTGGEPHLRDDLVDVVLGISHLRVKSLPKLRSIIITSNGFLTRQVISNYRDILYSLRDTNIELVSVTSIDGIGETHDLVRGTKGAFKLASETLNGLSELRREYPNLIPGIKTTILPQNAGVLNNILDLALSHNFFHIISPALFTEARFRNAEKRDELRLGPAENKKLLEFYSLDELKKSYFYSMFNSFLTTGQRRWVCTALYNYLFIDFDGKVYPCEIISEPIGNIKQQDIEDIWAGHHAQEWRQRIGKTGCCQTCHEPGAMRYSAFTEGLNYLRFLMKLGKAAYKESLYGEGFSKYTE